MPACIVKCPVCGTKVNSSVMSGNIACSNPRCQSRIQIKNGKVENK